MRHLHAPKSNHFNVSFTEAENVVDVFKIEHDIHDAITLKSKWLRMVRSPILHALMHQLCILCISLGTSVIAYFGRNHLPYSNFLGQSGKSGSASTPTSCLKSVSVRGTEWPVRLLAPELASSFDFDFNLGFDLSFWFVACHKSAISFPSRLFM
jgi:hypothetical protein